MGKSHCLSSFHTPAFHSPRGTTARVLSSRPQKRSAFSVLQETMQRYARLSLGRALRWSRAKKSPLGFFFLAPFIRLLACGQVKRGAPALAVGFSVPPAFARPLARNSRGRLSARAFVNASRPCLSLPWSFSPRVSASAPSGRLRASARFKTPSRVATPLHRLRLAPRGAPPENPFPLSLQGGGALAPRPYGSRCSVGSLPRPTALKNLNGGSDWSFVQPPPARQSWRERDVRCYNGKRGHHKGVSLNGSTSIFRSLFRQM